MTLQDLLAVAAVAVSMIVAIGTLVKAAADRRAGASATEHNARRDTVADRDSFIDQLQEEKSQALMRATTAEAAYAVEREYVQILRDHIYRRQNPPPPSRP